ncbi:MAG TPA: hypothetical protein VGR48_10560 [Terriglobales bacterium]|nr:hypothetical protein [Terriglobales bacterium]
MKQLQQQVVELRAAVAEVHKEAEQYRQETLALRRELQADEGELRQTPAAPAAAQAYGANTAAPGRENTPPGATAESASAQNAPQDRVGKLEDEYRLLTGELGEQYQTKVESASRYRVRLSGIAVFNLFDNFGTVNNVDIPSIAEETPTGQSHGSLGATFRQSELGLSVVGPDWAGAHIRGDVQMDFAGGFPATPNGAVFGLARLRTGTARLDWSNTSLVAGQDVPIFSPLSPTSVATLALPAFAYMGNLWTWVPQLRVEHRVPLSDRSNISFSAGFLDSVTGDPPSGTFYRAPLPGEASRQPGYGSRVAWTHSVMGRPLILGAGGYYGRQNWGFGRHVDSWAGTADWTIPLGALFSVQGEFYRGRGLGGFGAAADRSVVSSGPPEASTSLVRGLDVIGGWSQVKFQPKPKLEFNAGVGLDNPFASELRTLTFGQSSPYGYFLDGALARNSGYLFNTIYRPRSDLLFSLEYRHIRTVEINAGPQRAGQINLVMGVLF